MEQRFQLIDIARQNDAWILEDDFDGEYRFSGRPVPAMQGNDPSGRKIYVGTFSKTIFLSLRLGFMVLPRRLDEAAQRARAGHHSHVLVEPLHP
jgi:GntR family transcriptional regulator/MocR family aminotransferase